LKTLLSARVAEVAEYQRKVTEADSRNNLLLTKTTRLEEAVHRLNRTKLVLQQRLRHVLTQRNTGGEQLSAREKERTSTDLRFSALNELNRQLQQAPSSGGPVGPLPGSDSGMTKDDIQAWLELDPGSGDEEHVESAQRGSQQNPGGDSTRTVGPELEEVRRREADATTKMWDAINQSNRAKKEKSAIEAELQLLRVQFKALAQGKVAELADQLVTLGESEHQLTSLLGEMTEKLKTTSSELEVSQAALQDREVQLRALKTQDKGDQQRLAVLITQVEDLKQELWTEQRLRERAERRERGLVDATNLLHSFYEAAKLKLKHQARRVAVLESQSRRAENKSTGSQADPRLAAKTQGSSDSPDLEDVQDALKNIAGQVADLESRLMESSSKRAQAIEALRRAKDESSALRRRLKDALLESGLVPPATAGVSTIRTAKLWSVEETDNGEDEDDGTTRGETAVSVAFSDLAGGNGVGLDESNAFPPGETSLEADHDEEGDEGPVAATAHEAHEASGAADEAKEMGGGDAETKGVVVGVSSAQEEEPTPRTGSEVQDPAGMRPTGTSGHNFKEDLPEPDPAAKAGDPEGGDVMPVGATAQAEAPVAPTDEDAVPCRDGEATLVAQHEPSQEGQEQALLQAHQTGVPPSATTELTDVRPATAVDIRPVSAEDATKSSSSDNEPPSTPKKRAKPPKLATPTSRNRLPPRKPSGSGTGLEAITTTSSPTPSEPESPATPASSRKRAWL